MKEEFIFCDLCGQHIGRSVPGLNGQIKQFVPGEGNAQQPPAFEINLDVLCSSCTREAQEALTAARTRIEKLRDSQRPSWRKEFDPFADE